MATHRITLELNSSLDDYLPVDAPLERAVVEVPAGSTPASVIDRLGIPSHRVNLVYVNEQLLTKSEWGSTELAEGDVVAMWPMLAGG